jgi:hypothetical protein
MGVPMVTKIKLREQRERPISVVMKLMPESINCLHAGAWQDFTYNAKNSSIDIVGHPISFDN